MSDLVDKIISQWAEVHPELDTSGLAVVGRVLRLASLIRRGTEDVLAEYELTRPEFDVLCAVRRNGALTPGQITREMLSSGAAVTKRVDRLARMGLLVRERSTRDRRVAHIRLTDQGQNMLDELLPRHLAAENAMLAELTDDERARLARLLSTMLATAEGRLG
ncbi:MarR family winged helix-turn-helix transcriptional regulator [Prauserella oleivorans]|uniref:MarR family winged helix-turn-helix transcriptional regulator n=1 Tax=Prauserella oleivorans TaxID=1478153 RepID=A0ABW5WIQ6_9PSEU